MEVEVRTLAFCKPANVDDSLRFDAHALKRRQVRDRRDNEGAGIFEADEAPVEQMVDARSLLRAAGARGPAPLFGVKYEYR
jgi:hypothetical protein